MSPSSSFRSPRFQTTRWSIIARATDESGAEKQDALQDLCHIYWAPVYAFIRRSGFDRHQAEDLTQDFFADLIIRDKLLSTADQNLGRFRTYLLAAVKHQLANFRRDATALKRGGQTKTLSVDWNDAERRYAAEPADGWTPEAIFHRRWALTLLERVLEQLRQRYVENDREQWFDAMRPFLTSDAKPKHDELARQLNTTPSAVRVAVHRLRQQYRDALTAEIAGTLGESERVADERAVLLNALSGDVP